MDRRGEKADPEYGKELFILLPGGGELRFKPYEEEELPTYVRVINAGGREVGYWNTDEFTENAPLVLGAVLGAMFNE